MRSTSSIWSPPSRVASRVGSPAGGTDPARPKSRKNAADASTSGTPKVIDVSRCSPMAGQIRSNDRELQDVCSHASATVNATEVPRRRQARSEATRTALLDAALTEFAAHGFEGASTRAIACGGRNASAADQLSLRLEGRTVAGRRRPSLRRASTTRSGAICETRRQRPTLGPGSLGGSGRSSGLPPTSRS